MKREQLQQMRDWADGKITTGAEPPWSWFQYMKLREVLDQVIAGMEATTPQTANSPLEGQCQGTGPRLAVSNTQPSTSQPRQQVVAVQLPT